MFERLATSVPTAWTNFLTITEPSDAAAADKLLRLIAAGARRWQLRSTEIDKAHRKSPAVPIQARKREIAQRAGLETHHIPFLRGRRAGQYYYLEPGGDALAPTIDAGDASVIIQLCLLAALLNRSAPGLHADAVGSSVYLGARTFKAAAGAVGVEAFLLETNYLHREVQITLAAKAMQVVPGGMQSGDVLTPDATGFSLTLVSPDRIRKWDGRKTRLEDISFKQSAMTGSRLYLLNRVTETFSDILEQAGVAHERRAFAPTHATTVPRVQLSDIAAVSRPLVVVNNTGASWPAESHSRLLEALKADGVAFPQVSFHKEGAPARDRQWMNNLDQGAACLVLNRRAEESGTSIQVETTRFDRPWDAYHGLAQDILLADDVDAYTWAKFDRLYRRRGAYPVLQGIDLEIEDGNLRLPENMAAIRRCAVELAIKDSFSRNRIPVDMNLPEGRFTLLHTDRIRLRPDTFKGETLSMAAIVQFEISDGVLHLRETEFLPDIAPDELDALHKRFPCLGGRLKGDDFYLIDDERPAFLRRFTGAIVPKILLNARYCGIEDALTDMADGGGVSSSGLYSRAANWLLLPYYTGVGDAQLKKWRQLSFIEDRGAFVRYFVPALQPANASMGFSNLHDLMVYRQSDGTRYEPVSADLLDDRLIQLYLGTLTNGVMRLNESGKTSLLEKLARLAGMDT